ncbi:MAG: exodeoxyribonuclease VII small subunit [Cyanobacteria bacterium P01_E01_bin.6]
MTKTSHKKHDSTSPAASERLPNVSSEESGTSLPDDWNYETTVESIESIIGRIEMGDMELADIFDQFAIAVKHLHQCESFLDHHRQQVDVLIETLTD